MRSVWLLHSKPIRFEELKVECAQFDGLGNNGRSFRDNEPFLVGDGHLHLVFKMSAIDPVSFSSPKNCVTYWLGAEVVPLLTRGVGHDLLAARSYHPGSSFNLRF
jgi:hypothetical protein